MNDRGEYFALYAAFLDDPDTHALSDRAFRVLVHVKGALGAAGIGVLYDGIIAEQCRCTLEELRRVYGELEAQKPSGNEGWIRREANVVWLVNGLRFSPSLKPKDKKHRLFVQRLLAPLANRRLAAEFRARYAEWFEPTRTAADTPESRSAERVEPPSEGHRRAIEAPSQGHRSIKRSGSERLSDSESLKRSEAEAAPAEPPAPPPPSALASATLPLRERPGVAAFLRACYDTGPPARVLAELDETLTASGAKLEGKERVRAYDVAHLEACCRAVAEKPPRNRAIGMHFVLLKLRDTWLEAKAAAEKATHAPATATSRGTPTAIGDVVGTVSGAPPADAPSDDEVLAYFAAPEQAKELIRIRQDVERQFEGFGGSQKLAATADRTFRAELRKAYEQRQRQTAAAPC